MKNRQIITLFILVFGFVFLFIERNPIEKEGNTEHTEISITYSEKYNEEEIRAAIDVVLENFKNYPATLNKVWVGNSKERENYEKEYHVEDAIVIYGNFKTYRKVNEAKTGFSSNEEYNAFKWILIRNKNENWKIQDGGY